MLPVHDTDGQVVAMIGRWADGEPPEGKEKYRFPPGFEKSAHLFGLWQDSNLTPERGYEFNGSWLVLVEGPFDAIRLQGRGKPAAALLGSSLSDTQLELIKRHCPRVRHVAILMDGDEGGRAAADRIAAKLARHGLWAKILGLPEGCDPATASNELIDELMPASGRREAA